MKHFYHINKFNTHDYDLRLALLLHIVGTGNQIYWNCPGRDNVKNESDRILNFSPGTGGLLVRMESVLPQECMVPL